MTARVLRMEVPLAAVAFLVLAGGTSHAAPRAAAQAARQCATPGFIGGHVKCLRVGQTCKSTYRKDYLKAGFVCRRTGRKGHREYKLRPASYAQRRHGEVLDLGPSGRPTFQQALWWFDTAVAPLPGVRTPKGAVGRERKSGTTPIELMRFYRNRLTPAQQRVLDRVLEPGTLVATVDPDGNPVSAPVARAARVGPSDMPQVLSQALQRLRGHGLVFAHRVSYYALDRNLPDELAHANANFVYGGGNDCGISFDPIGYNESLVDRRVTMLHELMHCAAAEARPNAAGLNAQPMFLREGLPEWGAYRVAMEWQSSIGKEQYWDKYFAEPWRSLYDRSYDAVGWWSLAEHAGANLFALHPELIGAGSSGNARKVAAFVRGQATGIDADWGPTLATKPALGPRWDIGGPGQRPRQEPDKGKLDEGRLIRAYAEAAAGYEYRADLEAEVVVVTRPSDAAGLIRDSAGKEIPVLSGETSYCTVEDGCECPDGRDLGYESMATGVAHIGLGTPDDYGELDLKGSSIDEACGVKTKTKGRIDLKSGIVGGVRLGMPLGPIKERRTVTSLLKRPDSIIDDSGLYLATYDRGNLGVYFRPGKAGAHSPKDKVVGVLTYSPAYKGVTLSIGDPFPASDGDCAPADRRSAPGGGPRRVSACINKPGPAKVRDIIYMSVGSPTRAGQRISGIGVFERTVGTLLFNSLVQGALSDLGCDDRACS